MARFIVLVCAFVIGWTAAAAADAPGAWRAYRAGQYAAALTELKALADKGDAEAEYYLGSLCMDGLAVQASPRLAAQWYERAAEQGSLAAAFSLGFLYLNGAGEGAEAVAADPAKAVPWLTRAAAANYAPAAAELGVLYRTGTGVAADRAQAIKWSLVAARQGSPLGLFEAGALEAGEPGVAARLEAYKWFELAARLGYPGAAENRDRLAQDLSAPEIAEARGRADAFKPENGG